MSSILQLYVDKKLFPVRSDDDFDKLKKASSSLSKSEFRKFEKAIPYILAGFDPNISSSDPTIVKVESLITKESPTLLSQSNDSPRTIIRAVILESLYTKAKGNSDFARLIWLVVSNVISFYAKGSEKDILTETLYQIGETVEQEAIKLWSLSSTDNGENLESLKMSLSQLKSIESEITNFKNEFQAAAQYTNSHPNNWQHVNTSLTTFANSIRDSGASSIEKLIREIYNKIQTNTTELSNQIAEFLTKLDDTFRVLSLQNSATLRNRSQLLWWKESLYSKSFGVSYRSIDKEYLPFVMAFDLYNEVEHIYPVSIDYFLKETIRTVMGKEDQLITLEKFISLFAKGDLQKFLLDIKLNYSNCDNRSSLLQFINSISKEEKNLDNAKEILGIDAKSELSIADVAVWVFHEFQAYKIVNQK